MSHHQLVTVPDEDASSMFTELDNDPHRPTTYNYGKIHHEPVLAVDDNQGDMSMNHPAEANTCFKRTFTIVNIKLFLLLMLFVAVMTCEILVRKANTTIYMKNYRTFLNQVIIFACTIAFFIIVFYKKYIRKDLDFELTWSMLGWFALISVFDTLGVYMIILSATYVSAPLSTLLSQGVIPISMGLSYKFLARRFHREHIFGALVILGGIGFSLNQTRFNEDTNSETSTFGWSVVFFLSNIPLAFGGVVKEIVLSRPQVSQRAEMHSLNAWVALFQFLLGLALAPLGYYLQALHHNDVRDVFGNFRDGFDCLAGISTVDGDNCGNAAWFTVIHTSLVVILNIVALLIIVHGSAVIFFIAGAAAIPLTALISAFGFMGSMKVHFEWLDLFSIGSVLLGLAIYRSKPEE